jgi:hypothetical protein
MKEQQVRLQPIQTHTQDRQVGHTSRRDQEAIMVGAQVTADQATIQEVRQEVLLLAAHRQAVVPHRQVRLRQALPPVAAPLEALDNIFENKSPVKFCPKHLAGFFMSNSIRKV